MLGKKQMQEIQDLKLRGYTKAEILDYYTQLGIKPPSRPTISKYYDMDVVPEDPGAKLLVYKYLSTETHTEGSVSVTPQPKQASIHTSSDQGTSHITVKS